MTMVAVTARATPGSGWGPGRAPRQPNLCLPRRIAGWQAARPRHPKRPGVARGVPAAERPGLCRLLERQRSMRDIPVRVSVCCSQLSALSSDRAEFGLSRDPHQHEESLTYHRARLCRRSRGSDHTCSLYLCHRKRASDIIRAGSRERYRSGNASGCAENPERMSSSPAPKTSNGLLGGELMVHL
jgi:hypothetical protein